MDSKRKLPDSKRKLPDSERKLPDSERSFYGKSASVMQRASQFIIAHKKPGNVLLPGLYVYLLRPRFFARGASATLAASFLGFHVIRIFVLRSVSIVGIFHVI